MLTRALLGGHPPPAVYPDSEKMAARSAAEFSPTLPDKNCAYFVRIQFQKVSKGQVTRSGRDPTSKKVCGHAMARIVDG